MCVCVCSVYAQSVYISMLIYVYTYESMSVCPHKMSLYILHSMCVCTYSIVYFPIHVHMWYVRMYSNGDDLELFSNILAFLFWKLASLAREYT